MNDDELTEALRRMLRGRADRLHPNPGRPPLEGQMPAPAPRPDPWFRRARALTGMAAAVGAVAVIAAVVAVTGGHGPSQAVRTRTATAPPATTPAPSVAPASTSPTVAPTTAAPPPTTPVPTTVAPAPAVPAGFQALSVTFVSADAGWVLGNAPCGANRCPAMARTTDGGVTWYSAPAPAVDLTALSLQRGPLAVRFADGSDGWVYTPDQLWSTHDGGATWHGQAIPGGPGATIGDLEASAGVAYLVTLRPGAGEGVYSTPAGADSWTASALTPSFGGGPVPSPQIVLQGQNGWILTNNRTVVSGARNLAGAGWTTWTPPCSKANGAAGLAAASPTDLVAWCAEGTWGPPDAGTTAGQVWLFRSSDAGSTFSPVATVPASVGPVSVAPGQPQVILAVSANRILRSTDGGATWTTVYQAPGGILAATDYVGFTTATQAIAVIDNSVVMSRDGGRTWGAVKF